MRQPGYAIVSLVFAWLVVGWVTAAERPIGHEPIVGGPCEGCEAVFQGLPDEVPTVARIAPRDEPGDPMRIEGRVVLADGTSAPGTIVYAYHTDIQGVYPRDERYRGRAAFRHGRLRGWARVDESGHYRFDTVRPAGYPDSRIPQHVHMHVIEPGRCTYYISDIVFDDDPRLTPDLRARYDSGRGGSGVVATTRDADGIWRVERDIVLGEGVPGYEGCDRRADADR